MPLSPTPEPFIWGTASSAYQIEGAAREGGRGPSIWDVFAHTPGKIANHETGDVACDHYHRYREDISLMRQLNLQAYRFSVSWPRVLPQGRGTINPAGLDFYDKLVDGLCAAGIKPFVTLYHWDLPAALQLELGGWLHPDMASIFADYARVMYDRLGDRVGLWLTLNEPWCSVDGGYFSGLHAPGATNRAWGYQAAHNLLRAHAHAVAAYRASHYPGGLISFALNMPFYYPATDSFEDAAAAERGLLAFGGWFADPAYYGDYPAEMRHRLGALLPEFTPADAALLKGSADYIALNYYLSEVIRHAADSPPMQTQSVPQPDRIHSAMGWPVVSEGLHDLLLWLSRRYPSLPFFITENGMCCNDVPNDAGFVDDQDRIRYLRDHFAAVHQVMRQGVDVRGYLVWSLLDNFEWSWGFGKRFGLVRCDYETQRRTIKASGQWYARFISSGGFGAPAPAECEVTYQNPPRKWGAL